MKNKKLIFLILLPIYYHRSETRGVNSDLVRKYFENRQQFVDSELNQSFGNEIELNYNEILANETIMKFKESEYALGLTNPELFNPSRHLFNVLDKIKSSKLFKVIQKMPKGGILHIHRKAMCSADCMVSLTYSENLWQQTKNASNEILSFKISQDIPIEESDGNSSLGIIWRLVSDVRSQTGPALYDKYVRTLFTLFDGTDHQNAESVNEQWLRLEKAFSIAGTFLSYGPVHKVYFKKCLAEMLADGVQYLEFRGNLRVSFCRFPSEAIIFGNKKSNSCFYFRQFLEALRFVGK